MQESAEARLGFPDANGRIIGFFKLKSNLTILVESLGSGASSSYSAAPITSIAARNLAKKEAVKIRDAAKKLQVFEQSFLCGTGQKKSHQQVCNFVGFQLSSLILSTRGVISLSEVLSNPIEDMVFQESPPQSHYHPVHGFDTTVNGASNEEASLSVLHGKEQTLHLGQIEDSPGCPTAVSKPEYEAQFHTGTQQDIPVLTAIEVDECFPSFNDTHQQFIAFEKFLEDAVPDGGSDAAVESRGLRVTTPTAGYTTGAGQVVAPIPEVSGILSHEMVLNALSISLSLFAPIQYIKDITDQLLFSLTCDLTRIGPSPTAPTPSTLSSLGVESLCHVALFQTPLADEPGTLSDEICECGTPCMGLIFPDCERDQRRERPSFKALMQSLMPVRTSVDPREVNAAKMTHPLHDSDGGGM